jgi:DNA-binding NarL/FixJ family response regulator
MANRYGPVIVLEDDADDHEFIQEAYKSLNRKNRLRLFTKAEDVLQYLMTSSEQPFIIISEIYLRGMDGIQLREKILASTFLRKKSIPFVYFSMHKNKEEVERIYELQVQGYFIKKYTMEELTRMLRKILDYWDDCVHSSDV